MLSLNGFIFNEHRTLTFLLFFFVLSQSTKGQLSILDSTFTFRSGTIKTGNALDIISKTTGYNFTYDSRIIDAEKRTRFVFSNIKLSLILDSLLQNDSLDYSVIDRYIIISRKGIPGFQNRDSIPDWKGGHIQGLIIDDEALTPLPFATIGLKNKGRGTVSNSNGEFGLNIAPDDINDTLYITYLGYIGREIPVMQIIGNNLNITMKREFISIPEIIIRTQIPYEIINKSLKAIPDNYGKTPALLTGFYREGVLKKTELQSYSEAILQIYKSSYASTFLQDQIKVLKSRKIENTSMTDTLAIRLKAGLNTSLELDGVNNLFDFLDPERDKDYTYRITDIVSFDEDAAYAIDFEQREGIYEPLFRGTFYVNTEDYAILQANFELNPKYIQKIKESFIAGPTRGFNTWPVSAQYTVSYRKVNDRYFLSHARGDLLFMARQKRKLFNTQFQVFFELAITEMNLKNVERFDREELAPVHSVFSKTITTYDMQFWENQDFLKPEDDLLQALRNMKVRLREFSE